MSKFKYLRVLSFHGFESLDALPNSVGELIHFRYLNLSWTNMKTLPESLCNLYNLQTLKLFECRKLTKLPSGLQNLVNLHHLEVSGTSIEEMPRGMGNLKHLQHLDFFIEENGIKELGGLSNLCSFSIMNLENVTQSHEAFEARIKDKKHVNSLSLQWSVRDKNGTDYEIESDVLCKLQPHHQDLELLSISGYNGTRFPDWVGNFSYLKITFLSLLNCKSYSDLPTLGQLPSLKYLMFSNLISVKTINACFYMNNGCPSGTAFPSLESLTITDMPRWKVWISFDSEAFPRLKHLVIHTCPKLKGNLPIVLPAVETLKIANCKSLVSSLPRAPTLRRLDISKSNEVSVHELPGSVESIVVEGSPMVKYRCTSYQK